MNLPEQVLLSDLLRHHVRCDQGLDHGLGVMAWMHPPVHRLLGWISRPSSLRMSRDVWRLDQWCGITDQEVFVKGEAAVSDQVTLERLPTLLEADLLDWQGARLAQVADFAFVPTSGEILHYLVSRSDPRLPGTSRWRLTPDRILDQQPGIIVSGLRGLNDLPLARSSLRQDLWRRSRQWRDQFQQMGDQASDRLEGWLEEPPWEASPRSSSERSGSVDIDAFDHWDEDWNQSSEDQNVSDQWPQRRNRDAPSSDKDPWV